MPAGGPIRRTACAPSRARCFISFVSAHSDAHHGAWATHTHIYHVGIAALPFLCFARQLGGRADEWEAVAGSYGRPGSMRHKVLVDITRPWLSVLLSSLPT